MIGFPPEGRVQGEVQVALNVGQVILLNVGKGVLPNGHGHILVGRS
jgi:hypothetical protein